MFPKEKLILHVFYTVTEIDASRIREDVSL